MLPTASSSAPSSTITSPSTGKNSHVIRQKVMAVATAVAVVGTLAACGNDGNFYYQAVVQAPR